MGTLLLCWYALGWAGVANWYEGDGICDWNPPLRNYKFPFMEFLFIFLLSPPFMILGLLFWATGGHKIVPGTGSWPWSR